MPIVVQCTPEAPLCQGDILREVVLATTDETGETVLTSASTPFVLVVSRPCKAVRDHLVTVAPINAYPIDFNEVRARMKAGATKPGDTSDELDLDRVRRWLAGIRDGGEFRDAFYLGNLGEGSTARFAAQLTTLFTISIPTDAERRFAFLRERRVGRLDEEFLRDLHLRLSVTFTRLGFDDYNWFSDPDLDIMINVGEENVARRKIALAEAQRSVQAIEAANKPASPQQKKEVETKQADVHKAEKSLQPYLEERARRKRIEAS